jgi:hypothetical protein
MINALVTNNCVCVIYDEETGMAKQDEYGDMRSDECFGCFDESIDDLHCNLLPDWLSAYQATTDDYVLIGGSGMGWLRQSGKIIAKATGKDIVRALSINGDFTLDFRIKDKSLTATRSSHDELGAFFQIEVISEDEVEQAREWGMTVVE